MTIKPESLNPMDIGALYPKLAESESTESLAIGHAAIEELQSTAERVIGPLREQRRGLTPDDEAALIELVSDLREMFEHLGGHCDEASKALWKLTDALAGRD